MDAYTSVDPVVPVRTELHSSNIATQNDAKSVKSGIGHTEIAVMAYPIRVELDTPTDWPAISLPIALGLSALYFTWLNQKQQIRSSIASIREAWLKELRSGAVDFSATAAEIHIGFSTNTTYSSSPELVALSAKMFRAGAAMTLMLDVKHPENKALLQAMEEVIKYSDVTSGNYFSDALDDFNEKAQFVLEDAWKDIQRDLGHRPTLHVTFKKYLERKHPNLYAKLYGP